MFHPECLDVHASSLPPHTAKAGYLCPSCTVSYIPAYTLPQPNDLLPDFFDQKPIFPPEIENNPLVKNVNNYLLHASWAKKLITPAEPLVVPMPNLQSNGKWTCSFIINF